jgi:uncharacterized protein (TIGR00304 family)
LRPVLDLVSIGVVVIFVGVVIVIASAFASSKTGGEVRGGGVLLVGPIPIVFGSDAKWASVAILLAIVLVVVSILFYLA